MALPFVFANLAAGNQPASDLDANFNALGSMAVTFCTATGTNAVSLAQAASQPTVSSYVNGDLFGFVAAATPTGAVTINLNGIGVANLYFADGTTQVTTGGYLVGSYNIIAYNTAANGGLGGFQLLGVSNSRGSWTPTWTSLTVVGTPTYTGTYVKIGRMVTCELNITSTTTTASTVNVTTFTGLPYAIAGSANVTACNGANATSYGVGLIVATAGGTVLTPTWPAVQTVIMSFSYIAASD